VGEKKIIIPFKSSSKSIHFPPKQFTGEQKMLNTLDVNNSAIVIYKSFFEYNPDATYAILPNGKFILFNDSASKLTGYSKEEAIGMHFATVIDPEHLEKTYFHFEEALKGTNENFQSVLLTKKGERKIVSITIVPILVEGVINGIIGVTKDITEQVILETLKEGQNNVLQMITKNKPFQTVLDRITLLFEKISSNGGKCSILLLDESGTKLVPASAPNLPEKYIEYLNGVTIGENTGSCGTAAFSKKTLIVEDTQNDIHWEKYKEIAFNYNLMACWSIPLLDDHNNVLGTFAIYYDKCYRPSKKDLQLLEEASYLSSIAIQHYKTKEKINHMAYHDSLTGLPNRRLFNNKLNNVIKRSKQSITTFSVLFIDLDRFKNINDTYGHDMGDLFLIEVAKRLKSCLRNNDVIARLGGDEFTILLENATAEMAEEVADRIVKGLEKPFILESSEIFATPSIGISVYPSHGKNSSEILKKADAAMYQAKRDGGNIFKFHDATLELKLNERITLENHLRKALENNEFALYYQPKIELSTNKVKGVEALLRWNSPEIGMVVPDQFIPIAEETGLIIPIGEWVIATACKQLKEWKDEGLTNLTVAVNLSIRQFFNPNLIGSIEKIIKESGIDPYLLDLEITESMTMDVEIATKIINDLKRLGVKISIDDFGTGYSSINYLKYFPVDYLKIDKSFITDVTNSVQNENVVNIILLMAQVLGFKVVAEGVETKDQLTILKKLNCNEVQGYYFSKPLPNDKFITFFEQFNQNT
jgi:diguanylate cyclase (GGDEF)-like protein/PAS domain S-box-containing protein